MITLTEDEEDDREMEAAFRNCEPIVPPKARVEASLDITAQTEVPLTPREASMQTRMRLAEAAAGRRNGMISWLSEDAQRWSQKAKIATARLKAEIGTRKAANRDLQRARHALYNAQIENEKLRAEVMVLKAEKAA